jgi:hypothetical protein
MLRDTYPRQSSPATRRPFSLARCQMSWWFFIVISAYLFLILVTGDFNHALNEQTLVLIGIATGTALGSAFIDASKGDAVEDTLATLRKLEQELPAQIRVLDEEIEVLRNKQVRSPQETSQLEELAKKSASLKVDLDAVPRQIREEQARLGERVNGNLFIDLVSDRTGVSVHRFQMIVWTLVLSMVFVIEVFQQLSMPEFSTTLLALMGISSGTYLGFKIPEQQA